MTLPLTRLAEHIGGESGLQLESEKCLPARSASEGFGEIPRWRFGLVK
jgi:hypothetical protein